MFPEIGFYHIEYSNPDYIMIHFTILYYYILMLLLEYNMIICELIALYYVHSSTNKSVVFTDINSFSFSQKNMLNFSLI